MSNLLVLKHLLGVVLLQTFEQWGLEMCFKQQFVVWEFSFQCDAGFKFSGKKKSYCYYWSSCFFLSCCWTITDLKCSDAFDLSDPDSRRVRCFDAVAVRRGSLLARSSFPLSLPVSHFCRMFLLSWVPYCSHTELAGLPGLLLTAIGPLIGSSCALAFLAPLGLELQWARQHKAFWEESCRHDCERNQMKKYPDDLREQLWNYFIKTT